MNERRIETLDGLRGVAILLVVTFHYFGRWTEERSQALYPYGSRFANWVAAADGFVGVYLFFIISGFVIFRTLQRSQSIFDFCLKRADRLVLPMLVLSTLTYALMAGPLKTKFLEVRPADFLPSWSFTTPAFWRWVDPDVGYVDGVYWTLFTEVRFYLLIAIFWFAISRTRALFLLFGISVLAISLYLGAELADVHLLSQLLELLLFPGYICLFACGAFYADIMQNGWRNHISAMLCIIIPFSFVGVYFSIEERASYINVFLWCSFFHAIFLSLVSGLKWVSIFSFRPLVFIGTVSYSFYLVHQRVGVGIISRIPSDWSLAIQVICCICVALAMVGLAYLSRVWLETRKPFSRLLKNPVLSSPSNGPQNVKH